MTEIYTSLKYVELVRAHAVTLKTLIGRIILNNVIFIIMPAHQKSTVMQIHIVSGETSDLSFGQVMNVQFPHSYQNILIKCIYPYVLGLPHIHLTQEK